MNPLLKMNPLEYEHKILVPQSNGLDAYYSITNGEIFSYFHYHGLHLDLLKDLIPVHALDPARHVGNMYGLIVFIDGRGKFELRRSDQSVIDTKAFGSHPSSFDPEAGPLYPYYEYEEEEEDEDACNHEDFLVFDLDDVGNKYWCKICDERFPKHPEDMKEVKPEALPFSVSADSMASHLQRFKEGCASLGEISKQTGASIQAWSKVIAKTFKAIEHYEDQYVLGSKTPVGQVLTYVEPARTSDPLEIEQFFEDMSIHASEIQSQMYDKFPDIVSVDVSHDVPEFKSNTRLQAFIPPQDDDFYYEIRFQDDSVQRVYPKWGNRK